MILELLMSLVGVEKKVFFTWDNIGMSKDRKEQISRNNEIWVILKQGHSWAQLNFIALPEYF